MTHRPYRPLPGPLRRGGNFSNGRLVLLNKYGKFEGIFTFLRGAKCPQTFNRCLFTKAWLPRACRVYTAQIGERLSYGRGCYVYGRNRFFRAWGGGLKKKNKKKKKIYIYIFFFCYYVCLFFQIFFLLVQGTIKMETRLIFFSQTIRLPHPPVCVDWETSHVWTASYLPGGRY